MPTKIELPGRSLVSQRAFIRKLRKGDFDELVPEGEARKYPPRGTVALWARQAQENGGVTRNEDGQVSSLSMTLRYVKQFCELNHLKREEGEL